MRVLPLLAGVAAVACLGVAALAASPKSQTPAAHDHVLTVRLPDGSVEQIHYSGDVAPKVAVAPGGLGVFAPMPGFGPASADSPFAMLNRLSAQMDQQMAEMMRNAPPMPTLAAPGAMQRAAAGQEAALGQLPAGTESYSFVSSVNGGHACSRSVQITSQGAGQAPRVVTQTSGDCGGGQAAPAPQPAPTAAGAVHEKGAGKVIA
jgi:hypothetical protein